MKKIWGILLIIFAILLFGGVYIYIYKKGLYNGDVVDMLLDSFEFLLIIGALILLGIIMVAEGV